MNKPSVGHQVEHEMEVVIKKEMDCFGFKTRRAAAVSVRQSKPNWYEQTPEGEYLRWVIRSEAKAEALALASAETPQEWAGLLPEYKCPKCQRATIFKSGCVGCYPDSEEP